MTFEKVQAVYDAKGRRNLIPTGEPDQTFECDAVLVAVGQENAFPWIEREVASSSTSGHAEARRRDPAVDAAARLLRGDAALGPKNIIWAVAHGHDAAISIDRHCHGEDVAVRPPPMVNLLSQKMASTSGATTTTSRSTALQGAVRDVKQTLKNIKVEVEMASTPRRVQGGAALPELRRADGVHVQALHRMRCVRRHLSDGLLTFTADATSRTCGTAARPGDRPDARPLRRQRLKTGRVMVKDEDVCLHCGLCAERCRPAHGTCRSSCST